MNKGILHAALLCVALALLAITPASASPGSWSSYEPITLSGILQSSPFTNGVTTYTIAINADSTITIPTGGTYVAGTYKVNWIQSFVAFGATESTSFTAMGNPDGEWTWIADASKGCMFGWGGSGNERVRVGGSKTFTFSSLSIPSGSTVLTGLHIGYGSNGSGGDFATGFFSCTPDPTPDVPGTTVPEPGSFAVLGLGAMLSAGLAMARRRLSI